MAPQYVCKSLHICKRLQSYRSLHLDTVQYRLQNQKSSTNLIQNINYLLYPAIINNDHKVIVVTIVCTCRNKYKMKLDHIDELIVNFPKLCKIVDDIMLQRLDAEAVLDQLYRNNYCRNCITNQQQMVLVPCGHLICEQCKTTVCLFCTQVDVCGVTLTY